MSEPSYATLDLNRSLSFGDLHPLHSESQFVQQHKLHQRAHTVCTGATAPAHQEVKNTSPCSRSLSYVTIAATQREPAPVMDITGGWARTPPPTPLCGHKRGHQKWSHKKKWPNPPVWAALSPYVYMGGRRQGTEHFCHSTAFNVIHCHHSQEWYCPAHCC